MPSYLTVTSNGLFLFTSFEEGGVQKSDCFSSFLKANQIAGSGDFPKIFDEKYC